MKKLVVTTVFALASMMAAAQTSPGTMPPAGTTPSTQPQTAPSQTTDMPGAGTQSEKKTEKSLKGCIQSSGGQFSLEEKHGKEIALTGSQDLASHVGHTVTVHGTFANGSEASGATASASGGGMSAGEQFMVSKVDMVSEKCNLTKSKTTTKDTNSDPTAKPSPNRN